MVLSQVQLSALARLHKRNFGKIGPNRLGRGDRAGALTGIAVRDLMPALAVRLRVLVIAPVVALLTVTLSASSVAGLPVALLLAGAAMMLRRPLSVTASR